VILTIFFIAFLSQPIFFMLQFPLRREELIVSKKVWLGIFLIAGAGLAWALPQKQTVADVEIFAAIKKNDLDWVQRNLPKIDDLNITDQIENSLIHALVDPDSIVIPAAAKPAQQDSGTVLGAPMAVSSRPIGINPLKNKAVNDLDKRMALIRWLSGHGVPINSRNAKGETPLHLAVQPQVHWEVIPITIETVSGWSGPAPDPLQIKRFCKFFLDLGANPRLRDATGRTPIFYAPVELYSFLQHGEDLEGRDQNGMTPFLAADAEGALALLKLGADAQATDSRKRNRWHYLFSDGWEELAQKLIERRVDINQRDMEGRSPLLSYCQKEKFRQAIFLIEHGANTALADNNGQTALYGATMGHNLELMELLLKKDMPVNSRDHFGKTPIFYSRYNKQSAQLLLRYKASPNIPDFKGNNVLHGLADDSQDFAMELFSLFIYSGAFVNQKNNLGETPLVIAYRGSNIKAMKMLLENGADPNISTFGDLSLLDRAELDDRPAMGSVSETVSLLKKYGARRKRSWLDRHPQAPLIGYVFLGIIPLLTFLFSLYKPSPFTKKLLWFFIAPAACGLLMIIAVLLGGFSSGGDEMIVLILAMPPLTALLMSLSGTRALADRCPPRLGIPLSFLNAAGCMGLTFGIVLAFLPGTHGEGGVLLAYDALFGGGAAAVITLIFAIVVWIKRLSQVKNTDINYKGGQAGSVGVPGRPMADI
jgi:ankyrin repeat protein